MQNNLKKAQKIMLEMLIEVDRICKKYDIKYWLDSGTLLGAIRHQGFIPWDDDLDISMTLEDYRKFLKIAPQELTENMFLQTSETDKYFPYEIAKIRSNKGRIIEKHEVGKNIKYNQGIFIDIIPVICVSKNIFIDVYYKIIFFFIKIFSYPYLDIKLVRRNLIKYIDFFNVPCKKGKLIIRSGKFPEIKFKVKYEDVFPLKKAKFEGIEFFIPNNVDNYLKSLYGKDYMELPSKDEQHIHSHRIEIDE